MNPTPVAIVTGAGSGIGRAAALQLAQRRWATVLVGRDEAKLRASAEAIGPAAPTLVHAADISDPRRCEAIVAAAVERFGRVDALAQVAGVVTMASLRQTTDEIWRRTLETDLSGPFYMIRAAWDALVRSGAGVIVNVSSMSAIDPFPGLGAYAVAKAGLNMLTHVAAKEGEPAGIRVVGVIPGAVDTPMLASLFGEVQMPKLAPDTVGRIIAECITGERVVVSGESIRVLPSFP